TTLNLFPTEGIAVAVLCNANSQLPMGVKDEILAKLLPVRSTGAAAKKPGGPQGPPKEPNGPATGQWRGQGHTYHGGLPLTLWFRESGDIHARLGDQLKALVNNARWRGDELTGEMVGDIGTEDANRRPYHLHLDLKRRGDELTGALVAISTPGKR